MNYLVDYLNKIIAFAFIFILAFTIKLNFASATEFVDVNQSVGGNLSPMDTSERWQSFKPTKSNLSSVDLKVLNWTGGMDLYLRVVNTVTSDEVVNVIYPNVATTTPTPGYTVWMNFDFTDTSVVVGDLYKLYYSRSAGSQFNLDASPATNPYPDGSNSGVSGIDLTFRTYYENELDFPNVEIIDFPEWSGNIQVGSEYALSYNQFNFCFLGEDCFLKYNYGYDAIGGNINLLYNDVSIASSSLIDQQYLTGQFLLEDEETATTTDYCFVLTKGESQQKYCDVSVQWLDRSWCNEETICSDVATSSDFLFGVQCGFRQTICWIFNPSDESIDYLSKNIQNFENSFPFNMVFDFLNVATETIENSTTTGATFGIPWVSTTTPGEFDILPVIDQNTLNDIMPGAVVSTVSEYTLYFVWFLVTFLIIFIIVKFAIL